MNSRNNPALTCSECRRTVPVENLRKIDDRWVCMRCLCGDVSPFVIWPIGHVANNWKDPSDVPADVSQAVSEIRLAPGQERFMKGMQDEKHLTIVWALHRTASVSTSFARRLDGKIVGPFAARTPRRLAPIAITEVELTGISGTTLTVKGLDAIDGSPVLDIKLGLKAIQSVRSRNKAE